MTRFELRVRLVRSVWLAGALLVTYQAAAQTPDALPTAAGSGETIKTTRTDDGAIGDGGPRGRRA